MSSGLPAFGRLWVLLRPTSLSGRILLGIVLQDCAMDCAQSMLNIEQSAEFFNTRLARRLRESRRTKREGCHDRFCRFASVRDVRSRRAAAAWAPARNRV